MKLRIPVAIALGLFAQISMADQTAPAVATQATTTVKTNTTQAANVATPAPAATTSATGTGMPAVAGLTTDKQKISYSIGVDLGANFKTQGIDIDPATLVRGLTDALTGGTMLMTKEQVGATLVAFQKDMVAKQKAAQAAASAKNLQEGNAFLAANKTKSGIITTADGLQYRVVNAGKGTPPGDNDVVTVDYTGSFINGNVFDSSYQHGKPVTFPVSEVIKGWTQALKLMPPGALYEIYVPATLAYGEQGIPNVIGPNQTLIFKIHLISVKKAG